MFVQLCLQRTISSSQALVPIRTFKRFGEYVKNYGHSPKYDQGGNSFVFISDHWQPVVIFSLYGRLSTTSSSSERSTGLPSTLHWPQGMDSRSSDVWTEWLYRYVDVTWSSRNETSVHAIITFVFLSVSSRYLGRWECWALAVSSQCSILVAWFSR